MGTIFYSDRNFIQIGTIKNVKDPNEIFSVKFPVCYQFNIMVQSPLYNKVFYDY